MDDGPFVIDYHSQRERLVKYNLQFIQEITSTRASNISSKIVSYHQNILNTILINSIFGYAPHNFVYNQEEKKVYKEFLLNRNREDYSYMNLQKKNSLIEPHIYFSKSQQIFELSLPLQVFDESTDVRKNIESFQSITDLADRSPVLIQFDSNPKSKGPKTNTTSQDDLRLFNTTISMTPVKADIQKEISQTWIQKVKDKLKNKKNLYQFTKILIAQLNFIFKLLAQLIREVYFDAFNKQIGISAELLPTKEIFIQRLVQHFLFSKNYPVIYVLQILGECFYREEDRQIQAESMQVGANGSCLQQTFDGKNEPILDRTLVPHSVHQGDIQFNFEGLEDSSFGQVDDKVDVWRQSKEIIPTDSTKTQFQNMVEKSEKVGKNESIPYQETFSIITKIVESQKFWKKFRLIQKLDKLIVFLFMRKRSESQFDKCYDTISAEDSKSEIIFHIIYSYLRRRPQIDVNTQLFVPLRLMHDQDGFLHNDIKFIFCPPFLRFYSIVELIVQSENVMN